MGQVALAAPEVGLRQLVTFLSLEPLVGFNEDGRARPRLAQAVSVSADRLLVTINLRERARFQDGSRVTGDAVAQVLRDTLPKTMGPVFEDVESIGAPDETTVTIRLRRPTPFAIEALEALIAKPGAPEVGTGPYIPTGGSNSATEMRAFKDYYEGAPTIGRIVITPYPSVRAAWAQMLRGDVDMLYEVSADAQESMQAATTVRLFSFVRPYQYLIVFGRMASRRISSQERRALNAAVDRTALVQNALNGHGIPSTGPIAPQHWALRSDAPQLTFDPSLAMQLAPKGFQFKCLVPSDSAYERIALELKRQLGLYSMDMRLEEGSQQELFDALKTGNFEAMLVDAVSGPTLFRPYQWWHSRGTMNMLSLSDPAIDASLDVLRHARSDDEYRSAVASFQRVIVNDPPAVFLAWSERARAVSRHFEVPPVSRDIIGTIRLWRPSTDDRRASRN